MESKGDPLKDIRISLAAKVEWRVFYIGMGVVFSLMFLLNNQNSAVRQDIQDLTFKIGELTGTLSGYEVISQNN